MKKLADLTAPKCASCLAPHSCCSPEYCESAIELALSIFNRQLTRTDHPVLPLMGPTGCTAAPHFRPLCTLHVCSIYSFGFDPNDPVFTKKYFKLRAKVDMLIEDLYS